VDAGIARIHETRPDVTASVSITFGGIPDTRVTALTEDCDAMFYTYYQIGNDFGGEESTSVSADIDAMVDFAGDKQVVFKEWGYPTGSAAGGTESGQVTFIAETFAAWDKHHEKIDFIMFSRMFDGVRDECAETAKDYGFEGDESFIDFLCTLGLRRLDDTPKPAWSTLVEGAEARGF
jgi:hypothetical protein